MVAENESRPPRGLDANVESIRQMVEDIRTAVMNQGTGGGGAVDLSGVNAKLDSIAATLASVQSQVSTNGSTLSSLMQAVSDLGGHVASIQADLEAEVAPSGGGTPPPPAPASNS